MSNQQLDAIYIRKQLEELNKSNEPSGSSGGKKQGGGPKDTQRQDKITSKVRPVFNASSKNNQNISLNDNILCGPKTQESINKLSILMRLKSVVILADLQKMFHSIGYLEEPDVQTGLENNRDVFRILWSDDPNMIIQKYIDG